MSSYKTIVPGLTGVRGTHYTKASNFLYYVTSKNGSGAVYRLPLNPSTLVAEGYGVTFPINGAVNLNNYTTSDLMRTFMSSVHQVKGLNGARVFKFTGPTPPTSLADITDNQILGIDWNNISPTTPVNIDTANGAVVKTFYAVRIPITNGSSTTFNYAKVCVYSISGVVQIDWKTMLFGSNPILLGSPYEDPRDIVVSEYESEVYISGVSASGSASGGGYVNRYTRVVSGPYPQYGLAGFSFNENANIVLDEPQQLAVVDGSSVSVYVVDRTSVWKLDSDPQGDSYKLVSGLTGGIGLLLEARIDGIRAYIIDSAGDLRVVNLSEYSGNPIPAPSPKYSIGGAPGFLTWADEDHTAIYVPNRTTNQVMRIDLVSERVSVEASTPPIPPIPLSPWSVEVISPNNIYVASNSEIGVLTRTLLVSNVLALGIGLIPFQYINNSVANPSQPGPDDGKANTSSAPNYYFSQYPNVPFGGNLSLMINHELAWNSGIRYYRLSLRNVASGQSRPITNVFTDLRWSPILNPPRFETVSTATTNGAYPIRNPADLWYNPYLGAVINTNASDNGHNVLKIEFLDANMQPVADGTFYRLLLIDNTPYGGRLELSRIGSNVVAPTPGVYPTLECGCLSYTTKNDLVEIDFGAWHPQASGQYTLSVSRGGTDLALLREVGPVTAPQTLHTKSTTSANKPIRVGHLVGDCDVANISIALSVPSRVIDGFGWVNLSAYFSRSFTMLKGAVTHTPWQEPQ